MDNKNEQQILQTIKFTPPLFIISLAIIITIFLYFENRRTFESEKQQLIENYTISSKERVKEKIDDLHEYIINSQKSSNQELKKELQQAVDNAYNIANTIYLENKDKEKPVIIKMIKDALRNIRFNDGRGYFFIYELTGKNILHPTIPSLEGKDLWKYKDAKGTFLLQEMNKILQTKEKTFYSWYWFKPNEGEKQYEKLGVFKRFEPFSWFIGTGEYIDDYEKKVQNQILRFVDTLTTGENGYVFVIDYNGDFLSHVQLQLLGKNAFDIPKVEEEVRRIINVAKNGEGFLSYVHFKKPETGIPTAKISYVKGVDNWQWAIGEGFYQDDTDLAISIKEEELNEKFSQSVQQILLICLVVTLLLITFSLYVAKRLEEKFQIYRKEIDDRLGENIRQHNILSQQSKMAAMGEMIGNIAHQWRQPLSTITTAATGLKFEKQNNILTDENFIKVVDKINNSAQYLSQTIDDFRNFFKSNKNRSKFFVNDVIDKTVDLIDAQLKNKDITIVRNIDNVLLTNLENELIQVLLNMLNNSRDELIKKDYQRLIVIEAFEKKQYVYICVHDNAGGIDKDNLPRIFEPYFTTKHQSRGTGIGLYMSSQIINIHMNGNLTVSNEAFIHEGKDYVGAKFVIKLPLEFNQ